MGRASLAFMLLLTLVIVVGPALVGDKASTIDAMVARQGASLAHPLGTDHLGRDNLSRVIVATRLSVLLAMASVSVAAGIGYSVGLFGALSSPRIERLSKSALHVALAFPPIIVAIFVGAIVGRGSASAVFALGVAFVPLYARTMLNLATSVAGREYIHAARMLGVGRLRLLWRHVTPNVAGPLWIQGTVGLANAMVALAALSFLGLGVKPPDYDWGRMLADGLDRIFTSPAAVFGPALAITVTGVMFAYLGEAAARSIDPTRWTVKSDRSNGHGISEFPPILTAGPTAIPESGDDKIAGADVTLLVEGLRVGFPTPNGMELVVKDVSFQIAPGERVGLVGESGSGKSMTAAGIAGLVPHPGTVETDELVLKGFDLSQSSEVKDRVLGTEIGIVFQDPLSSLTPTLRIGTQMVEAVRYHHQLSRTESRRLAAQKLREVQMPGVDRVLKQYPSQLSGGMRQRVMIAMALMTGASLLIADEPTTSLDVTTQSEILRLLEELSERLGISILFITHDLSVVEEFCHRVMVMKDGEIVEELATSALSEGTHPYTRMLWSSVPTAIHDRIANEGS